MSTETETILDTFRAMLQGPTGDGKGKRDAGLKAHWTVDTTHKDAMLRHLGRWWNGEQTDADSGCHPLVHLAWRALAVAWQETHTPEVPGQATFWQEILDGGLVQPQGGYIDYDPRPLPRTIDRAPAAQVSGEFVRGEAPYSCATERDDPNRQYVEAAFRGEPSAKGHHPC